jgi:hypothetical protein
MNSGQWLMYRRAELAIGVLPAEDNVPWMLRAWPW